MNTVDRRKFLKILGSGAAAATLPGSISRALATPAHNRTGSIADIEHIVVLTQENRSFDHYFGNLNGVRGYNDPRAVILPSGKPVWNQPDGLGGEVLPFRPDLPSVGNAFLPDPPHGWNDGHRAWNNGRYDRWVPNKGVVTMSHLTRADIPYHYALADAFTICDAYYCSVKGPTDPNRYHLWSGWLGNNGNGSNTGPVITNAEAGYDWMTFPERLQKAGITWKVYQDVGTGLDAEHYWGWGDNAYIGNYGDNSLLYLHQYQNAADSDPLARFARTGTNISAGGTLFDQLRQDVANGTLPQVSWIAAPEAYSEHPNWPANWGAWYIDQILQILISNPDLWSRTAFLINWDEDGGFFDHMVGPTPPQSAAEGKSTVSIENEIFPGDAFHPAGPYGLGVRVPLLIVSPWSKGGYVNSQVFDHTSVIRFIEARYATDHPEIIETNITPWRRAVVGDLTTAFDFRKPNSGVAPLPATTAILPTQNDITTGRRFDDATITPPSLQSVPKQEPGIRRARALPYALDAQGTVINGAFQISFLNTGAATAVFHVRSGNAGDAPRTYTVEPGKQLVDTWGANANGLYDLAVYGPNGFLRSFKGGLSATFYAQLEVTASAHDEDELRLLVINRGLRKDNVRVVDNYTAKRGEGYLPPGQRFKRVPEELLHKGWYDITVTVDADSAFTYRLAGHIENGADSITDPAMGGLAIKV